MEKGSMSPANVHGLVGPKTWQGETHKHLERASWLKFQHHTGDVEACVRGARCVCVRVCAQVCICIWAWGGPCMCSFTEGGNAEAHFGTIIEAPGRDFFSL